MAYASTLKQDLKCVLALLLNAQRHAWSLLLSCIGIQLFWIGIFIEFWNQHIVSDSTSNKSFFHFGWLSTACSIIRNHGLMTRIQITTNNGRNDMQDGLTHLSQIA